MVLFVGSGCSTIKFGNFSTGGHIINLVTICLGFQWSLLCRGFSILLLYNAEEFRIGIHDLTESLMSSFSLLISSSFVLGRTAPINNLIITALHPPLYTICRIVNEEILMVTDPGSILPIHLFGAIFGWTLHLVLLKGSGKSNGVGAAPSSAPQTPTSVAMMTCEDKKVRSIQDIHGISYLGSVVIMLGFSTLNGLVTESDAEMCRVIINTLLAQTSSILASLTVMVGVLHIKGEPLKFTVLLGSLVSGGITVGCIATLMLQPYGAITVGLISGYISTTSYLLLEPLIKDRLNLPCSDGMLSFHGVAAFVSGIAGALLALMSEESDGVINYYNSLYPIYPARVPACESSSGRPCPANRGEIISTYPFLEDKAQSRSAADQAGFQAAGLALALSVAVIGGLLTGLVVKISSEKCGNRFPSNVWRDETFILNKRKMTTAGEDSREICEMRTYHFA